ncbi:aminopeptidase P family protein [Alloprevotella tannerae]|uniref:aminopeptidase P family protein n=1 Tax=Alloprevotella tannerae TaxID=76122 RepID=UPI0025D7D325|nr:aminopeptidase P family protein [Alloprevotella tannerae]
MLFSKDTYVERRRRLREMVSNGLILIFGNNDAPMNCPANTYKFRQDSSFLYFFAQHRDRLVGVIDADSGQEWLIGDEIDIDDIVWFGSVKSVGELAAEAGVEHHAPMAHLAELVNEALKKGRKIHFLPPYRFDTQIQIMDLLNIHPSKQKEAASLPLIQAVVKLRSVKSLEEIEELERAATIGHKMHTTAMRLCRPGVTEQYIGGQIDGIAASYGCIVSFQSIVTMHGEIMHGNPSPRALESGRLMLCDAGAETNENYCSDNTRTTPISGKYTQRQKEIYQIVVDCHDLALDVAKPGVRWWDVHFDVCRLMTNRLKELGLMKGDTEEALRAGAHALFLPHGLGHMMGLDVHDMEGLGQIHVGFDEETRPSTQFGTGSLRMGRKLEEGFVVTDEPGIYFIPDLIDYWKAEGINKDFINFDKVETYKDFGGIRIEDDVLITKDGCRFLGNERIPYHIKEVEDFLESRDNQ